MGRLIASALGFALVVAACQDDRNDSLAAPDPTNEEILRLQGEVDDLGSKWMAAISQNGTYSPSVSRLLAVEALRRSPTPEAWSALGQLLFRDDRRPYEPVTLEHDGAVWVVRFSPDDQLLATGSEDGRLRVWDHANGELVAEVETDDTVQALQFAADGSAIAVGSYDGSAALYATDGELLLSTEHDERVNAVGTDSAGTVLATASHDGTAHIVTADRTRSLNHDDIVWGVAVSPDGSRIMTGSQAGTSHLWTVDGEEIASYTHADAVGHIAFSPDGAYVFAGGAGGVAFVIDPESGDVVTELDLGFGTSGVHWSSESPEVAWWNLGGVRRVSIPSGVEVARLDQAGGERAYDLATGSKWAVVGSGDFAFSFGVIGVWDVATDRSLVELNTGGPIESVDITGDGRWIAAGFRNADGAEVAGSVVIFPGRDVWLDLACEGTDGIISAGRWAELVGPTEPFTPGCPGVEPPPPPAPDVSAPDVSTP